MPTTCKFPTTDPQRIDTKEVARLIRMRLKAVWPSTKFQVRIDRYSGGSAINISYTDGPSQDDVEAVTKPYAGSDFDGMIDSSIYLKSWLYPDGSAEIAFSPGTQGSKGTLPGIVTDPKPGARYVQFMCDHVFIRKSFSPQAVRPFIKASEDFLEPVDGRPVEWSKTNYCGDEHAPYCGHLAWRLATLMDRGLTPQQAAVKLQGEEPVPGDMIQFKVTGS